MMTYLKRRFSSTDLQAEEEASTASATATATATGTGTAIVSGSTAANSANMQNSFMNFLGLNAQQAQAQAQAQHHSANMPGAAQQPAGAYAHSTGPGARRTTYTSAPASPTKTSALSFNVLSSQISNSIKSSLFSAPQSSSKCKILLVIDEPSTDWSKYFRGKKILNDFEIRVEQATFSELHVTSFSEQGAVAEIIQVRDGQTISRSFKPDFVLIRQHVRDGRESWKDLVIALQYGGVPGVNNLQAVYNFHDKPWVFSQLIGIQQRMGREQFPLIEQAFYSTFKDMMMAPRFPVVVKVGHAHSGAGKMRVESQSDLQDVASLIGLANTYATTEQFVDAKYDIRVQKIGTNYKAFIRKSISGNWKANIGANVLEKVPMNDRFKAWIDECSQIFGGLDICALEMVHGKDGQPYIIDLAGCCMPLLGETQEEDRRLIADLVYAKMQQSLNKSTATATPKVSNANQAQVQQGGGEAQAHQARAANASGADRTGAVANGSVQHGGSQHSAGSAGSQQGPVTGSSGAGSFGTAQPKQPSSATSNPTPAANPSSAYASPSMQAASQRGASVPASAAPMSGNAQHPSASHPSRTGASIPSSGSGANLSSTGQPTARSSASPVTTADSVRSNYSPGNAGQQPLGQAGPGAPRFGPGSTGGGNPMPLPPARGPFAPSQPPAQGATGSNGAIMQRMPSGAPAPATMQSHPAAAQQAMHGSHPRQDEEDTMTNLRKTFAGIFGDS